MKLSYIVFALAALAVANAGSVNLKVEGEKITITPGKAAPITAPLVKETTCHFIIQETGMQTCAEESDPTICQSAGWKKGSCPAAGFPTCCHLATISTQWFKAQSCPVGFDACPKNLAAPITSEKITAPPVKDPCHKIVTFRTEKPICIQQAYKGECPYLPDYASGGCAAAGFPLCCQGNEDKEQAWHDTPKCPAGTDVCPKNLAAPIMKLVKKNAKFQKLLAVWDDVEKATDGGCPVPGHCGRVYQGCCFAAKGKEFECKCKLTAGNGAVGDACEGPTKAGACGDAYAACCAAYKRKGSPCTCDIALPGQWGSGYRL